MVGVTGPLDTVRGAYLAKRLTLFLVIAVLVAGSGVLMERTIHDELGADVHHELAVVGDLEALLESFEVRCGPSADGSGAVAGAATAVTDGGNGPRRSD